MTEIRSRSHSRALIIVFALVGLLARLAVAAHGGLGKPPAAGSDAVEYDSYAWNIAQGNGYRGISPDVRTVDGRLLDHPTAYRAPGTATFWAGFYRIFGHRYDVVRIAQCILGALTVVLIFRIARQCFDSTTALIAAAIYAVWPASLFYSSDLGSEALYTFLFSWFIFRGLQFGGHPSWLNALASGLLLGLAILTRPNAVFMLALTVPWGLYQFRRTPHLLPRAAAICLTAIATLIPWTIRNYGLFHAFVPFQTGGGDVALGSYNRIIADDPDYYGYWVYPTSELPEYRERISAPNDEVVRDRVEMELAFQWVRRHPEKWGHLIFMRFIRSLTPFLEAKSPRLYRVAMLWSWGPILLIFSFAFFPTAHHFLRSGHPGWLINLGIMHFIVTTLIFWGASRFRYPVEGLCIILACAALVWISTHIRRAFRGHDLLAGTAKM